MEDETAAGVGVAPVAKTDFMIGGFIGKGQLVCPALDMFCIGDSIAVALL